jgi:hypothetical protein
LNPNCESVGTKTTSAGGNIEREEALTNAIKCHGLILLEAQVVGNGDHSFVPIAELRLDEEIAIDQEALHFDPQEGRGFEPHGFLTSLRKCVYPVSAEKRPWTADERKCLDHDGVVTRFERYLKR